MRAVVVFVLLFGAAFFVVTEGMSSSQEDSSTEASALTFSTLKLDYFIERALDTLFVVDTSFLEVRLDSQSIVYRCRGGSTRRFLCSTGNKAIHKAIETTEGIFCVQSKSPIAISRQFDSTKMYFWVGFNGNIGFHGLDGHSYYRYLGKRPSSHGCIRMAREDAEWMFQNIPLGTPVIVHSGNAARCLALVDSVPSNGVRIQGDVWVRRAMDKQLRTWYKGRAFLDGTRPYYFQRSNVWWGGIPLGESSRLPMHQQRPMFAAHAFAISQGDALRDHMR